jgi:hypothetical protein
MAGNVIDVAADMGGFDQKEIRVKAGQPVTIRLTGFWHPNAPADAMRMYLPKITLPTVVVAAAVDGINPCAFTVLLLFITAMLATMQVSPRCHGDAGEQSPRAIRTRILSLGGIHIAAVFFDLPRAGYWAA